MKNKTFDCVEMKREGARRLQARLAGMSREARLEFWRARTVALRARQLEAQQQRQEA